MLSSDGDLLRAFLDRLLGRGGCKSLIFDTRSLATDSWVPPPDSG